MGGAQERSLDWPTEGCQQPLNQENSPPLSAIVQSDDQTVDAKALAFPGNPEQITGSKRVHRKAGESSIGGRDQLEGV